MRQTTAVGWLVLVGLLVSQQVQASPRIGVGVHQCAWLDSPMLARLTRLELGSDEASRIGVRVDYRCDGKAVEIVLSQQKGNLRVSRRVASACCEDPAKERTLALLALGLLRTARAVLTSHAAPPAKSKSAKREPASLSPGSPSGKTVRNADSLTGPAKQGGESPAQPPKPQSESGEGNGLAPQAAREAAVKPPPRQAALPRIDRRFEGGRTELGESLLSFRHRVGLGGQVALHHPKQAVNLNGLNVRYTYAPFRLLGFGAELSAAFGRVRREGGSIDVRLLGFQGHGEWRFLQLRSFSLSTGLGAGLAWLRLQGEPSQADFSGSVLDGATGMLTARLVPAFRTGRSELRLPVQIGYLFRAPRGTVPGDEPVQVDGVFLALGLDVHLGFGALKLERQRRKGDGA